MIAFLILKNFVKKNKLTEKNSKPEVKTLAFMLYFVMASTFFPIWFYSTPTQLIAIAQLITIVVGVIMTTIFIALLTEVIMLFSDGKHLKLPQKRKLAKKNE